MNVRIVEGRALAADDIRVFNLIIRKAFGKEDLALPKEVPPVDVHFFLEDNNNVVAVGRFVRVKGIRIGNNDWDGDVWGRSLIAVMPEYWGKGYGKRLTVAMVRYGQARNISQVGIHGKKAFVGKDDNRPSLTAFYKSCGLEVDEALGARLYAPKAGGLKNLAHTNISYLKGDPFIKAAKASREPVYLPFSW